MGKNTDKPDIFEIQKRLKRQQREREERTKERRRLAGERLKTRNRLGRSALRQVEAVRWMTEMRDTLIEITKDCRPDMHEPDEQDIAVVVHGDHLDNACGESVDPDSDHQEFVIEIRHELEWNKDGSECTKYNSAFFNLASLIAVAKTAVPGAMVEKL